MDIYKLSLIIAIVVLIKQRVTCSNLTLTNLKGPNFHDNYQILWGDNHVWLSSQGRNIHISLDQSSGSAFESKTEYGSGFFHLNIKLPGRNSAGVITAFYLTSASTNLHDELDFEFLGNQDGKPTYLQTNVILDGKGDKEQRIQLWFDPTASYHNYRILWNRFQVVFFVDEYPIRVFMNKHNVGVPYPSQPMKIVSSIWNGDSWATDGGLTKINWSYAPFIASFRSFTIRGCPAYNSNMDACYSSKFWWNRRKYWQLNPMQERAYQNIRRKYLTYDYCTDRKRYPKPPPECP